MNAFIPYGIYWSSPFAKWQGTLANLNALPLAAAVGKQALTARGYDLAAVDLAILGITNPQKGSFYGLPWVTGLMGIDRVAGPTVQQACATSVRALQMAAQEVACGTATSALLVMADRQSNGPVVYYPDSSGTGGYGITEHWVPDNMGHDPYAKNPMLQTGENVAARYGITTEEQHALKLHRGRAHSGVGQRWHGHLQLRWAGDDSGAQATDDQPAHHARRGWGDYDHSRAGLEAVFVAAQRALRRAQHHTRQRIQRRCRWRRPSWW